jgi:signal transduction histidine kinase
MTNTVKHGHSSQIFVELNFQKHNVMLKISDDGCGFDFDGSLSSLNGRYGLLGMHERTSQLGGTITIKSQADLGTEITVVVPIIS